MDEMKYIGTIKSQNFTYSYIRRVLTFNHSISILFSNFEPNGGAIVPKLCLIGSRYGEIVLVIMFHIRSKNSLNTLTGPTAKERYKQESALSKMVLN